MDLPSFTRAAGCLSQAAATLSTAAQAMAMAAEAFSSASLEMEAFFHGTSVFSVKHMENTPPKSQRQSPNLQNLDYDSSSAKSEHTEPQNGYSESIADIDYYMSDEDEDYVNALLKQQQEEKIRRRSLSYVSPNRPLTPTQDNPLVGDPAIEYPSKQPLPDRPSPVVAPESSTLEPTHPVNQPNQFIDNDSQMPPTRFQRHIIVRLEGDVLPVVCAVSRGFDKVIIYMHCALPSISLYQKIIKAVTETSVYSVDNLSQATIDRTSKAFDKQKSAVILFPDSVHSGIALESTESLCVIHLGWPHSAATYQTQVNMHAASHAILVACACERDIYPSCSEVLSLTSPWPEDSYSLIGDMAETLRPKVQSTLSEIPNSLKEAYYLDWIKLHGPKGGRCVESWTPTVLVYRANLHLSDVLQYHTLEEQPDTSSSSSNPFPRVSVEFVKSNGLDSAVDDGVLNMIGMHAETTSSDSPYSSCKILTAQDEFDVLPMVCELARSYGKVVCYLAYSLSIITLYKELIQVATGLEVMVGVHGPASLEFQRKSKAVLLLPEDFCAEIVLDSTSVTCLIHAGWPSNSNNYLKQIAQHAAPISILVTYAQDASLFPSSADMMSQMVPYAHENTLAASSVQKMRTSVERILAEMPIRDIQALYENWISNHGPHGHRYVQPWTPLMLALRANQYLLDVLKYEVHLKAKFTLPASLPALWPSYIAFHGLQPAVDVGVLNVIAPATMIRTPNVAKPEAEKPAKGNTSISREYVIVSDMFDIIPAVCNLAADKAYKNTICYVKIVGIMQTLVAQIQKMTSKPVFIIATENSAAIPKALQALDSTAGGLVFCNSFAPPTGKLYTKKLDQVIHVGWAGDVVRYKAQANHLDLLRARMILTPSEHTVATQPVNHLKLVGLRIGSIINSSLVLSRDQWRQQLKESTKKSLNGCYMEWMLYHGAGPYKVQSWSKVDLVVNANIFATYVLLRGTGSAPNLSLLGGSLAVTSGFSRYLKLQPAIDAKILRIED